MPKLQSRFLLLGAFLAVVAMVLTYPLAAWASEHHAGMSISVTLGIRAICAAVGLIVYGVAQGKLAEIGKYTFLAAAVAILNNLSW